MSCITQRVSAHPPLRPTRQSQQTGQPAALPPSAERPSAPSSRKEKHGRVAVVVVWDRHQALSAMRWYFTAHGVAPDADSLSGASSGCLTRKGERYLMKPVQASASLTRSRLGPSPVVPTTVTVRAPQEMRDDCRSKDVDARSGRWRERAPRQATQKSRCRSMVTHVTRQAKQYP